MTQLPQWGRNHYMRETKNGSQHAPAARHAYPIKHSNTRASGCRLHGETEPHARMAAAALSESQRNTQWLLRHLVIIVFRCLPPTVHWDDGWVGAGVFGQTKFLVASEQRLHTKEEWKLFPVTHTRGDDHSQGPWSQRHKHWLNVARENMSGDTHARSDYEVCKDNQV